MWCFQCGLEYGDDVEQCAECGVPLVDTPPGDLSGADEEVQIAYELHEWSGEARRHLDQLITAAGIVRSWQGASLVVREADEAAVDELVEDVETTLLPSLDPDAEYLSYGLEGWSGEQQDVLSRRLGLAGIAHEFDADGDLVVHAADEEAVDEIVEAARTHVPADDGTEIVEGVDLHDLLAEVFVAADRLRRHPDAHEAVLAATDAGSRLIEVRRPFGFEGDQWGSIREATSDLLEVLAEESTEEDVVETASRVRDLLRPVV